MSSSPSGRSSGQGDEILSAFVKRALVWGAGLVICHWSAPLPACAADELSVTGRVRFSAGYALDRRSVREDPDTTARLIVDGHQDVWQFHSWIEGGWDGTVQDGDGAGVLRADAVYQNANPFVEVKELYVEREAAGIEWRSGLQRFAWGRLDEYPINDLFNPWDYRRFIVQSMEERKIGVPAVSAGAGGDDWSWQFVWVPWFVPYRLPAPESRWSPAPLAPGGWEDSGLIKVEPKDGELPARTAENSSFGLRLQRLGAIEWAFNLFHGFDPRPVFRTTALTVTESHTGWVVDPGYVPDFHKITAVGLDAAAVAGAWGLRAEAAYTADRVFNVRPELWGYPDTLAPGVYPLYPSEAVSDTVDYGLAADYSPFEDGLLTVQAQQTRLLDRTDAFSERSTETLLWANFKAGWLNQKVETTLNLAWNPEHGATMARAFATYVFTDSWKAGLYAIFLDGPPASLFGRYAANDQIGLDLVYSW